MGDDGRWDRAEGVYPDLIVHFFGASFNIFIGFHEMVNSESDFSENSMKIHGYDP
jgi:hypothetical protein